MGEVRLSATLVPRGLAAAVVLDDQQVAEVGEGAKRFPVVATVNDHTWRTTITRMRGEFLLGLSRAVRQEAGDTVDVKLAHEAERLERIVRAGFDRLSYTHRKEYARWIAEAKRDETRERRLAEALETLRHG